MMAGRTQHDLAGGLAPTACPLCLNGRKSIEYRLGEFTVYRCCRCGMVYLAPRFTKERIAEFYNRSYFRSCDSTSAGYSDYAAGEVHLAATYRRYYKALRPHLAATGRLLDIGCGFGSFLQAAAPEFRECVGLDISQEACQRVRNKGFRAIEGDAELLDLGQELPFDAVVMTDLIEHIYDLDAFMTRLVAVTKPGAAVLVLTPDYNSWLRRVSGARWVSFKVPEHVSFFTRRTLTELFVRHGFRILTARPAGQYAPLSFVAGRMAALNPALGSCASRVIASSGLGDRALFVPNGNMLVVARRNDISNSGQAL